MNTKRKPSKHINLKPVKKERCILIEIAIPFSIGAIIYAIGAIIYAITCIQ